MVSAECEDLRDLALHPLATLALPAGDCAEDWERVERGDPRALYEVAHVSGRGVGVAFAALALVPAAYARAQAFLTEQLFAPGLFDDDSDPGDGPLLDPPLAPLAVDALDPELADRWALSALLDTPEVHSELALLLADPLASEAQDADPGDGPFPADDLDGDPLLDDAPLVYDVDPGAVVPTSLSTDAFEDFDPARDP